MTTSVFVLIALGFGFLLGACEKRRKELLKPLPVEFSTPTYEEMKHNVEITDADYIMRIGAA